MAPRSSLLLAAVAVALGAAACGDDGGDAAPEPLAAGELRVVEPGGDTVCSRGTPYRFYAVGGDPERLVVDFQGGGACWNAVTCSVSDALFTPEAPAAADVEAWYAGGGPTGLYRLDDPRNPVAGWTLLHIPYCTGDIHWGDAVYAYADDLTIRHKGLANTRAALGWLRARYPDAREILVTGCSAGAYGAIGHAARVAAAWPSARITVVADSGAGVISDTFFQQSFPNWNAEPTLREHLRSLDGTDLLGLDIVDLYLAAAEAMPGARLAQQNTAFDDDQTFYFTAMGGAESQWSPAMRASLDAIRAGTDRFRFYLSPGPVHCLHPYDAFYDRTVDGVAYTAWLRALLEDGAPPADAACEGDGCYEDPLCAACAATATTGGVCRWCKDWQGAP